MQACLRLCVCLRASIAGQLQWERVQRESEPGGWGAHNMLALMVHIGTYIMVHSTLSLPHTITHASDMRAHSHTHTQPVVILFASKNKTEWKKNSTKEATKAAAAAAAVAAAAASFAPKILRAAVNDNDADVATLALTQTLTSRPRCVASSSSSLLCRFI